MTISVRAAVPVVALPLPTLPASAVPQPGPVGGPVAVSDPAAPAVPVSGILRCTIQVDAPTHGGPDAPRYDRPPGTGSVAVAPSPDIRTVP